MYYIVFSHYKNAGGTVHYRGYSKSLAMASFNEALPSFFNLTAAAGNLYFAGFKSDITFVKELTGTGPQPTANELIGKVLRNISLATCLNTLVASGYKPKLTLAYDCEECECTNTTVQKNAYGTFLCASCWTSYLASEKGLIEYYIGIAKGVYNKVSFSATDLENIEASWAKYKDELGKSNAEKTSIELAYTTAAVPT